MDLREYISLGVTHVKVKDKKAEAVNPYGFSNEWVEYETIEQLSPLLCPSVEDGTYEIGLFEEAKEYADLRGNWYHLSKELEELFYGDEVNIRTVIILSKAEPEEFYCTKPSDIPCHKQCDLCKKCSPKQGEELPEKAQDEADRINEAIEKAEAKKTVEEVYYEYVEFEWNEVQIPTVFKAMEMYASLQVEEEKKKLIEKLEFLLKDNSDDGYWTADYASGIVKVIELIKKH